MGLLKQDALAGSVAAGVTAAAYALPEHAERAVDSVAWGRAPLVPFEVPLSALAGYPLTVSTVPEAVGFTAAISAAVVCYQFRHPGTGDKAAGSAPMEYGMKTFMQSLGVLPRSLTDFLPFKYFWGSLNCVYALIAAVVYYFANPSLERCATFELDWMGFVLARNLFLMFFYYEAFYTALYRFGVAKKKFNEKFVPAEEHRSNIFWCVMGTIQWSVWEIIFMHLWGSGKLPYIKDEDFFKPAMLLRTIGWTLAIPLWREFHFYWIHRLIHVRVLYKYVHYLHHKAHNPEPYSGIRMHPIEHLFCKTRPLAFLSRARLCLADRRKRCLQTTRALRCRCTSCRAPSISCSTSSTRRSPRRNPTPGLRTTQAVTSSIICTMPSSSATVRGPTFFPYNEACRLAD